MTSLVESEAHFNKRTEDFRMAPATVQALQSHGFTALGHLAYAVGQPGQIIPEAEFNTFCRNHVPGASSADVASVRRLLFEGQTLALQQLRLQLTELESTAKRVPEAERDRRMALLRNSLSGLCIEGPLEPGRKLLDECCHQEATGQLKYLAPDRCISRLHEVTHGRPAARQVELDHSKLVIREHEEITQPAGSALQVQESLRRRGLAYTFAQAVSWQAYDTYLTKLFAHLHREPPPGFNRVSVSQIVEADRQVFVRLIEANTKPRKDPSGSFPLDAALLPALQSYEVSFSLMHTTGKGSGSSGKSNKRQKTSHGQQPTWGADKGKGKGKKGKKGTKMQPLWAAIPKAIRDLGGVANLPSGEPICFDYSLHGDRCRCKADSCPRKHVCAKCFGDHPLKDHKE